MMHTSAIRTSFVIALTLVLSIPSARACTFEQTGFGSFFEVTYPGSLRVAAAVAKARSDGRLATYELGSGKLGYMQASYAMVKLGARLDKVRDTARVDFFVILSGSQLWTNYQVKQSEEGTTYKVKVHAAAPEKGVPVIVTSYFVVVALQDGSLTLDEAIDAGLVDIRGDENDHVARLLREAFPV